MRASWGYPADTRRCAVRVRRRYERNGPVTSYVIPPEELTLTANAQPALMAHSMAVLRVLEVEGKLDLGTRVALVAGHSLGEYSALTAARADPVITAR